MQFIAVWRLEPSDTVGAQLQEADAISSLAFVPTKAAARFIVV